MAGQYAVLTYDILERCEAGRTRISRWIGYVRYRRAVKDLESAVRNLSR